MMLDTLLLALALGAPTAPVPPAAGPHDGAPAIAGNRAGGPAQDSAREEAVQAAITRAIAERMGPDVEVTLEELEVLAPDTLPRPAAARAVPPPGARTGRLVSFALFAGKARLGTATAVVHVRVPHVRTTRSVPRDTELTALDTAAVNDELEGALFERLPALADLANARVRRDVAAGEALTRAIVQAPLAVRSGDTVEVIARFGLVEARGVGRASGSGHVGDRVRVSRPGVPGLVAARIVAPGIVELIETFAQIPAARVRRMEEGR